MPEKQDHSVKAILANALEKTDPDEPYSIAYLTLVEIVGDHLEMNGFHGLYLDGECACLSDDLSPGDCLSPKCRAGYKHPSTEYGFVISNEPPEEKEL